MSVEGMARELGARQAEGAFVCGVLDSSPSELAWEVLLEKIEPWASDSVHTAACDAFEQGYKTRIGELSR